MASEELNDPNGSPSSTYESLLRSQLQNQSQSEANSESHQPTNATSITTPDTFPLTTSTTADVQFPPITRSHINNCQFSSWFPKFSRHSLKSKIIRPLPKEFIEYLEADGVVLPLDVNGCPQPAAMDGDSFEDSDDEEDSQYDFDEEDEEEIPAPSFPDLEGNIQDAITQLGGKVFPKLNWSSPKDATWIATTQTLECQNPADVFLLLKSSDFVVHDLSHSYDHCIDKHEHDKDKMEFELVLRKWYDLAPSMEFRCFVRDNKLVGICQRDYTNFYEFLGTIMDEIEKAIVEFYDAVVKGAFPDPNYTFDVYINKSSYRPFILDFNPCAPTTDALLFTWTELLALPSTQQVDTRIILSEMHASSFLKGGPKYGTNRVPKDAIELSQGMHVDEFVEKFVGLWTEAREDESPGN